MGVSVVTRPGIYSELSVFSPTTLKPKDLTASVNLRSKEQYSTPVHAQGNTVKPPTRYSVFKQRDCCKTPRSRHFRQHYLSLLSVSEDNVGETKQKPVFCNSPTNCGYLEL